MKKCLESIHESIHEYKYFWKVFVYNLKLYLNTTYEYESKLPRPGVGCCIFPILNS